MVQWFDQWLILLFNLSVDENDKCASNCLHGLELGFPETSAVF